jgi:hypothetical protein
MILDLSYTSSASARSCTKKFYYGNVLGLIPKKTTSALTIGSVIHECFDSLFKGKSKTDILTDIKNTFRKSQSESLDPNEQERLTIDEYTVLGMWNNYPMNEMEFEEVHPEESFKVKLDGLRGVYLTGRVDGLVKRQGKWWIREVKTTSMDRRSFQSKASVSYQASGYIYGIEKQFNNKIEGIVYDVIKRPLLRRKVEESAMDFGERIYDDYRDPKKKEFYYDRHFSYRTSKEISEFEKDMVELAKDIRVRKRVGNWYRNTDSCYSFNSECPYKKICWIDNPDEGLINSLYERKTI